DYALGTLLNLAACEERTGKLATAWGHYGELVERLPASDERRAYAQERRAAIEPAIPRLTIVLTRRPAPGTRVVRDGIELGAASLGVALPVDAGDHAIEASADDRGARKYVVHLARGERRTLVVEAGPLLPPDARPSARGSSAR